MKNTTRREHPRDWSRGWAFLGGVVLVVLLGGVLAVVALAGQREPGGKVSLRNGFRLTPSTIPVALILGGGPPRDGIPALNDPTFEQATQSEWKDDTPVLGLEVEGDARAYPIAILNWHELVNDTVGGRPILVSYCPLCGTGIVFDRRLDGRVRHFGVSGLLYQSDLLLYDRETESLWSQVMAESVTGPSRGARLAMIRSSMTNWGQWRRAHPRSQILSTKTGYDRPYHRSPYAGYEKSSTLMFPVPLDRRYPPKMWTLGLRAGQGQPMLARAYPATEVQRAGGKVEERFAGVFVRIEFSRETGRFNVEVPESVEVVEGYWFAWAAFHPQTSVFGLKEERR